MKLQHFKKLASQLPLPRNSAQIKLQTTEPKISNLLTETEDDPKKIIIRVCMSPFAGLEKASDPYEVGKCAY